MSRIQIDKPERLNKAIDRFNAVTTPEEKLAWAAVIGNEIGKYTSTLNLAIRPMTNAFVIKYTESHDADTHNESMLAEEPAHDPVVPADEDAVQDYGVIGML